MPFLSITVHLLTFTRYKLHTPRTYKRFYKIERRVRRGCNFSLHLLKQHSEGIVTSYKDSFLADTVLTAYDIHIILMAETERNRIPRLDSKEKREERQSINF